MTSGGTGAVAGPRRATGLGVLSLCCAPLAALWVALAYFAGTTGVVRGPLPSLAFYGGPLISAAGLLLGNLARRRAGGRHVVIALALSLNLLVLVGLILLIEVLNIAHVIS